MLSTPLVKVAALLTHITSEPCFPVSIRATKQEVSSYVINTLDPFLGQSAVYHLEK